MAEAQQQPTQQQQYIDELITRDSTAFSLFRDDPLFRSMGFEANELELDMFGLDPALSSVQGVRYYGNYMADNKSASQQDLMAAQAARESKASSVQMG